jgi:hypothetical protein
MPPNPIINAIKHELPRALFFQSALTANVPPFIASPAHARFAFTHPAGRQLNCFEFFISHFDTSIENHLARFYHRFCAFVAVKPCMIIRYAVFHMLATYCTSPRFPPRLISGIAQILPRL